MATSLQGGQKALPFTLSAETINVRVVNSEYAVRGEIVVLAGKIEAEVKEGTGKYPFSKVVWCNIGNPQILGQRPITYFREVLALCELPRLMEHERAAELFPSDVLATAHKMLAAIPGGVGAYSESAGAQVLRQMVADSISIRDGHPCNPNDIYMTDGASPAVHYMMDLLLRKEKGGSLKTSPGTARDGMMVPIPQYPLYSATLTLYGE